MSDLDAAEMSDLDKIAFLTLGRFLVVASWAKSKAVKPKDIARRLVKIEAEYMRKSLKAMREAAKCGS